MIGSGVCKNSTGTVCTKLGECVFYYRGNKRVVPFIDSPDINIFDKTIF